MKEKYIYWINDIPRNAAMNMAIDEILFTHNNKIPVLRTYYWDNTYITIGYFQKNQDIILPYKFIRRITGGLTVIHNNDISYCFVIKWPLWDVYDCNETYKNIHIALHKSLHAINIKSIIYNKQLKVSNNQLCLNTVINHDLILNGKKIVGSCLRRRKDKLLVQGAIHIHLSKNQIQILLKHFLQYIGDMISMKVKQIQLSTKIVQYANTIMKIKYSNKNWNDKF
jgi:lipoate-protein ligase A